MDLAILSLATAILASSLTYFYSVKTTTKGLFFDAKMTMYGTTLSLYYEIFNNLERVLYLQEIDASNEIAAKANRWNILAELHGLGDSETLMETADSDLLASEIEKKGDVKYVEALQIRAIILCSRNAAECLKKAKAMEARFRLVNPGKSVLVHVERAGDVIKSSGGVILKDVADKHPEIFEDVASSGILGADVKTRPEWKKEAEEALMRLAGAMRKDLIRTVRIHPFQRRPT